MRVEKQRQSDVRTAEGEEPERGIRRRGSSPFSSPPDDFTPRSMTPSLALSGLLWKEALRERER